MGEIVSSYTFGPETVQLELGDGRAKRSAELSPRTFWSFAGEFSSFRRQGGYGRAALISDTLLPVYGRPRDLLVLGSRLETHGPAGSGVGCR